MAKLTLENFITCNSQDNLFAATNSFVLGVSGGIDSMVMLDLFRRSGLNIAVAHVNHRLRGKDADEDADFVRKYCTAHDISYAEKSLDPMIFKGKNVQETARRARYAFFYEVKKQFECNYICTAHHADDLTESFFMHLLRGSGLKGLSSIPYRNKDILRPLLYFSKIEIEAYARSHHIEYREDYSNEEDKYLRNRIRHHLIPVIRELHPEAVHKIQDSIHILKNSQNLIESMAEAFAEKWKGTGNEILRISKKDLFAIAGYETLLFNILSPYKFTPQQLKDILISTPDGSKVMSQGYTLWHYMEHLILTEHKINLCSDYTIDQLPAEIIINDKIYNFELTDNDGNFNGNVELILDSKSLSFPLEIRQWRAGDKFSPLGMKGKSKKVKDFLTDMKTGMDEKKQVPVLISGDEIAAVLPYRISEHFKVEENTKKILRIRWKQRDPEVG